MATKTYFVRSSPDETRRIDELTPPWQSFDSTSTSFFRDIMCIPGKSAFVTKVGKDGSIMTSFDAGVTWSYPAGTAMDLGYIWEELWIVDDLNAFCVGETAAAARTVDGGITWDLCPTHPTLDGLTNPEYYTRCVHFISPLIGVAITDFTPDATQDSIIFKTIDGGDTWTPLAGDLNQAPIAREFNGVHMSANQQFIVAHGEGSIWLSSDAGATFALVHEQMDKEGVHLTWINDLELWSVGLGSAVHKSIDGGATWTTVHAYNIAEPTIIAAHFYDSLNGFIGNDTEMHVTADGGATWTLSDVTVNANDINAVWTEIDDELPVLACPHFNIDITGPSCAPDCISPGSIVQFDLGGNITPSVYPTTIHFTVKDALQEVIFEADYDVADDDELDAVVINFIAPGPGHYCAEVSLPGCNTLRVLCFDVCEPFDIYKDECNKWHVHRPSQSSQTLFLVNLFALEGDSIITEQLWDTEQNNTFPIELPGDGIYIFEMRDPDTKDLIYSFSAFETCSLQECYMILMDKIMCSCSDPCCKKCTDDARQQIEFARITLNKLVPLYMMYLGMARRNELYTVGMKLISDEQQCFLHDANQVWDKILEIIEDCGCLCPEQKNTASNRGGCTTC